MRGQDGAVRPHWQVLDRALSAFGPGEMWRRWEQARQLIRQHGVSFNVYGDARGLERPWPLDPVPVVLAPDEFASLAAGLAQRATLLDRLLADLYGPRRVLARGAAAAGDRARRTRACCAPCAGIIAARRAVPALLRRRSGAHARGRPARAGRSDAGAGRAPATRWRTGSCSGACCRRRSANATRSGWRCSSARCATRWRRWRRTGARTRASCC